MCGLASQENDVFVARNFHAPTPDHVGGYVGYVGIMGKTSR